MHGGGIVPHRVRIAETVIGNKPQSYLSGRGGNRRKRPLGDAGKSAPAFPKLVRITTLSRTVDSQSEIESWAVDVEEASVVIQGCGASAFTSISQISGDRDDDHHCQRR